VEVQAFSQVGHTCRIEEPVIPKLPEGSRVVVEHTGDPAGPHFHAGMPKGRGEDATREGVNFGWDGTDPVKDGFERYQKIDKPGGDHHLFYRKGSQCPG
jgi:hypothetical protein